MKEKRKNEKELKEGGSEAKKGTDRDLTASRIKFKGRLKTKPVIIVVVVVVTTTVNIAATHIATFICI